MSTRNNKPDKEMRFDNTPIPYHTLIPDVLAVDAILVALERLTTLCKELPEEEQLGAIREELSHTDPLMEMLLIIHAQHAFIAATGPMLHIALTHELLDEGDAARVLHHLNESLDALFQHFRSLVPRAQKRLDSLKDSEGKLVPWEYPQEV